jgi:hypothetical protein
MNVFANELRKKAHSGTDNSVSKVLLAVADAADTAQVETIVSSNVAPKVASITASTSVTSEATVSTGRIIPVA